MSTMLWENQQKSGYKNMRGLYNITDKIVSVSTNMTFLLFLLCDLLYIMQMVLGQTNFSCAYYQPRLQEDSRHICEIRNWYGMWPYEREILNDGKTNIGNAKVSNCYLRDNSLVCKKGLQQM